VRLSAELREMAAARYHPEPSKTRLWLHCGVCTASCEIVQSDRIAIPRVQMSLVQSGRAPIRE